MRRMVLITVAVFSVLGATLVAADRPAKLPPANPAADPTAADLQAMQGRWSREAANRQGAPLRFEKLIDGNRDTVDEFDANGNKIRSHSATFNLKHEDSVRIFTFANLVVTGGPVLGAQFPGPASFIYKLDGDTMYEVWGLLEGNKNPPLVFVWKRNKNNP
jgi:hypothetical protein